MRDQFLVEVPDTTAADLAAAGTSHTAALLELNTMFTAWVETVYHRHVHSETRQTPMARWTAGWDRLGHPPVMPSPAALTEEFLWEERRTVTRTATVSLHSNAYQVDPALGGRRVELVFDPFDLATIEVRHNGRPHGSAVLHRITRHTHPKAKPETPETAPPASGIDYLKIDTDAHHHQLAADERISRGPDHLVRRPARPRRGHRRGRRRQDRRRPRRDRGPGPLPPPGHLPTQPTVGVRGMLHHIVATLGQVPSFYTATLAAEHAERGRTPVLVIDEAHLLDNPQMEAVRILTKHDMDSGAPFATLLVGQPTLRQRLRLGVLAALDQRIGVRATISGMSPADTADYITHHLKLAGRTDTLFTADATTLIHNASRGYPRAVNNLALNALTASFTRDNPIVDEEATRAPIAETNTD